MAQLKINDLLKEFPARHPDAGKLRYTMVNHKINKGLPFDTKGNRKVVLIFADKKIEGLFKKGDLKSLKNTQPLFVDDKGKKYAVQDLEKTKDFGGGGGSGAGAEVTELAESAQCLYAALVFYVYRKQIKPDHPISKADLEKASKYIDVDAKFDDMLNKLPDDWITSSIYGANKLYEKFKGDGYVFHRGSKSVNLIESNFKEINKVEKAFGDLNKWSPADMYIIKRSANLDSLTKHKSIKGFNQDMVARYKKKEVIGVSLKKMVKPAVFSENNLQAKDKKATTTKIGYKGRTIVANVRASLYDSMDIYIQWGNSPKERMQLRSFGSGAGLTGWQGELKGESASQGKVSLGPLSFMIKQHTGIQLPTSAEVATRAREGDPTLLDEIFTMANKLRVPNMLKKDQHTERARGMDARWKYSKYLGLRTIMAIESIPQAKRDVLMYDIYSYAGSKSSFSGPYAKVE